MADKDLSDIRKDIVVGHSAKDLANTFRRNILYKDKDFHYFILTNEDKSVIEIDLEIYTLNSLSMIYLAPNQVSDFIEKNLNLSYMCINGDLISPGYGKLLSEISPAKPFKLNSETSVAFHKATDQCKKFLANKPGKKESLQIFHFINLFLGSWLLSYQKESPRIGPLLRQEIIAEKFDSLLEQHYKSYKSPLEYARKMNLSISDLEDCLKRERNSSILQLVRNRNILEAKRLLINTNLQENEIANELGYNSDDAFIEVFNYVVGQSPRDYRQKKTFRS